MSIDLINAQGKSWHISNFGCEKFLGQLYLEVGRLQEQYCINKLTKYRICILPIVVNIRF